MTKGIRIALAQIDVTVGDLANNEQKIKAAIQQARNAQADVVAFPELVITGYPPEDLLLRRQFVQDNLHCLNRIIPATRDILAIVGFADREGNKLFNAAAVIANERLVAVYHKIHLPNYGVFDEKRYFEPGERPLIVEWNDIKIGLSICEDIWIPDSVVETQAISTGAEILLNISSSPYHSGKVEEREILLKKIAVNNRAMVCYVNLIGGQDELVFDGSSLILNERGEILARGKQFEEDLILFDLDVSVIQAIRAKDESFQGRRAAFDPPFKIELIDLPDPRPMPFEQKPRLPISQVLKLDPLTEIYQALVLGTRDYVRKNGFQKVVLGLSGGIDSALTAAIAVDALGSKNVIGVSMPSIFSSKGSIEDAAQLAKNLGIKNLIIPIQNTFEAYQNMLQNTFDNLPFDITEENIQARIRGNIVMALSNKFGWLALSTGNKSEISVGYCTLYGDMAGGFAVIKDVPKTLVYQLAKNLNKIKGREIIPHNTMVKPPSAELRPNQKDEDSLPPYDILDPILAEYVEKDASIEQIVALGFDEAIVRKVIRLVDQSEYKRRQGAPGVKITPRAFGKDRRMPITNRYRL
ncbi:MAG: NAD+ synthase [candidate division KSB1 bacterium]|nr:NAD+ synthase [candidate division KSB1 bacterium]MDZ7336352.1 NAD+ synthase [candidate division KSB1 bacterium]MDZ7356668.1 NAD+ synthase [candidate division KSB1 bacterium]